MNQDTSIEARFEGHEITEHGVAQIPNMLLWHYRDLGILDAQFALLSHIIARKWTREAPYPSLVRLPMSANLDSRRRYVRDLRHRGLVFTSRLYWTNKDREANPNANPGRVRSNLWYLSSLMNNLVRVRHWLEEGKSISDFQIEIPLITVKMFLKGEFHDTPEHIARSINEQTQYGVVLRAITLPCENHTVGKSTMRFSSSSFSSSRKTHSHEEEAVVVKKKQEKNKKQDMGADAPEAVVKIKTRIKDLFLQKTNLAMPNRKTDQGYWWSNFAEIANIAGQDAERAMTLVGQVVDYMLVERLSIVGPQSIVNLCRSQAAGQSLTNGGTNGQTKRSNIRGLRELGSDNPIKGRFNTTTGEEYYVDARTGRRVHPDGCRCYECAPEAREEYERLNAEWKSSATDL